jgi:hypothetical protein
MVIERGLGREKVCEWKYTKDVKSTRNTSTWGCGEETMFGWLCKHSKREWGEGTKR